MYSTIRSTTSKKPAYPIGSICGKYFTYPEKIKGSRKAEAGLRLCNKHKKNTNEQTPLVSIITVCYNAEKTIKQCIESVLKQSYDNIEFIVIDGLSTDNTNTIIDQYIDYIDYYISEPDDGLYHAMNKGLSLASGKYILMLNSDDWYEYSCVESLLLFKKHTNKDFVSSRAYYHHDIDGRTMSKYYNFNKSVEFQMTLRHETMLISSEIYNNIGGYNEKYSICSDWELTIRILQAGYTGDVFFFPLLNFGLHGASNTNIKLLKLERTMILADLHSFLHRIDLDLISNIRRLSSTNRDYLSRKYPDRYSFHKDLFSTWLQVGSLKSILRTQNIRLLTLKTKHTINICFSLIKSLTILLKMQFDDVWSKYIR